MSYGYTVIEIPYTAIQFFDSISYGTYENGYDFEIRANSLHTFQTGFHYNNLFALFITLLHFHDIINVNYKLKHFF